MYFSKNIPEVNPVVINYKITHKNWPVTRAARYYLAQLDRFFRYYLQWLQELPWRKACSVCELARALSQSRQVDEYCYLLNLRFPRTKWQILRSQLLGERRIGDPVNFSLRTTSMKVIHESFLPQTIPNIRYVTV